VSAEQQAPEGVNLETGEVTEPPAPEPEPGAPFEEPEPEQEQPDAEPEPGEGPQGELTEEQIEKLQAQAEKDAQKVRDRLDGEAERHRKRLAEILQEDVLSLVPCELCRADLAGWVETATPLPDEVKQRVRIQIGDREPENWQDDPHSARCSACDGLGEVQTGSRVRGQEVMPCVDCGGKGWQPTDDTRSGFRPTPHVSPLPPQEADAGNGGPVNHPALTPEDQEAIKRLKAKSIVVIVPEAR
jgi:hypothetical protein